MTRRLVKNLGVVFLTGAIMMSCAKEGRYAVYASTKPDLAFEWAVPSEWAHEEFSDRQLGFSGVTFTEKIHDPEVYESNFVVTAKKKFAFGLPSATLAAVVEDTAKRYLRLKGARLLKREAIRVAGQEAVSIEVAYQGLSQIYTPGSKEVSLRQRIVLVPHGDAFYVIRCTSDAKKFQALELVFRHALKTFRFFFLPSSSEKGR